MSVRWAGLIAPVALVFGAPFASAQHHGGGGHMGGAHMGGMHMGGAHYGGMHYGGGHHPGYGGYYSGARGGYYGGYGGIGYGLGGFGLGYGLGYPYYYGGLGYSGYGYGLPLTYGMGRVYSTGYYSAAPSVLGAPALVPNTVPAPAGEPAAATINLTVPDGAQVWVDGKETPAPGGKLTINTAALQPGTRGVVNIKARWNDSTREMNLPVTAGDKMSVDLRNQ